MNAPYKTLFLLFIFGIGLQTQSQPIQKDSLLNAIKALDHLPFSKINQKQYVDLLLQLSRQYMYVSQDSFFSISQKALSASKAANYGDGLALATANLGKYYAIKKESKKAIQHYNKGLAISDSIGSINPKPTIYNYLGLEYHFSLDNEKALYYFLQGLEAAEKSGNTKKYSDISENIAIMYASQEQFKDAYQLYHNILKINKSLGNQQVNAETRTNLSAIEAELGRFKKSHLNIDQSIAYFEENGPKNWLAIAYGVKGFIFLKQEKFKEALLWFEKNDKVNKQIDNISNSYRLIDEKAATYFGLKEYEKALTYGLKGLELSKKFNQIFSYRNCAEILYKVYKKQGDLENALYYNELYLNTLDSIARVKSKKSLALYKTKMSFERDKQLLIAKNKEALAKQRNFIWTMAIILLSLLGMAIPLYINHKKLQKLLKKIEANTKDLREREVQLNTSNKTKNRLFSIIGHDLRGPIGALQELLRLIENGDLEQGSFEDFIPKIKNDVDHILFTLNNLLSWGNSQSNRVKNVRQIVPLRKIADQNVALLTEMANRKQIAITNKIPTNTMVLVDLHQTDVVLRNLISNAIKFTPKNGLISLNATEMEAYWKITVQDNGVGMDKKTLDQVLDNHSTLTKYGTNNEKGTGLGLSLCKEMIEKNRGQIWAESEPKKGSTFYFTLPKVKGNYKKTA